MVEQLKRFGCNELSGPVNEFGQRKAVNSRRGNRIARAWVSCLIAVVAGLTGCGSQDVKNQPSLENQHALKNQPKLENEAKLDQQPAQPFIPLEIPLAIPGGWQQLPEWAAKDLPFDVAGLYSIEESKNREQLYLKAFLNFELRGSVLLIPEYREFEAKEKQRFVEARQRDKAFSEVYDILLETPSFERDADFIAKGRKALAPYQHGFDLLKTAQSRPHCFFHLSVDTASVLPHTIAARDAARKLSVQCNLDLESLQAIENLAIGLQLQRDLKLLGDDVAQFVASGVEGICIEYMVLPILRNKKVSVPQIERLIGALQVHAKEGKKVDPFVEAAKYEHLMFKRLFHDLATNTYLPRSDASEIWGDDLPAAGLMYKELTEFCFYQTNSDQVSKALDELGGINPEIAQAAKKAKNAANKMDRPDALDAMVIAPLLLNTIEGMTDRDYQNEMKVLTTRFQQIEAANELAFPDSTKRLLELQESWTTDETWKKTKILKWFTPHKKLVSVQVRNLLRSNAMICLAAVRKWQLEHSGQNPPDLESAIKAAGIDGTPIDPHSGKPLKFAVKNGTALIYSVGPDGFDDQAKFKIDYWDTSPEKLGDILFTLN